MQFPNAHIWLVIVHSSCIERRANIKLMETWFKYVEDAGLKRGDSIDLDYHTVPANSEKEPLQKHYLTRRSRSQKGILVFLARDAQQRVLCYANATVSKENKADEILRFVDFWKKQRGHVPKELVFDSQLTTQKNLRKLTDQGVSFITLRRRSKKILSSVKDLWYSYLCLATGETVFTFKKIPYSKSD